MDGSCSVYPVDTSTFVVSPAFNIQCGVAEYINDMKMKPNSTDLWVSTDAAMYVIDTTATTNYYSTFGAITGNLKGFSFSTDGSLVYVSKLSASALSFSTSTGALVCTFGLGAPLNAVSADVSPDGTRPAVTTTGPSSSIVLFELVSNLCYLQRWVSTLTGTSRSAVWSANSNQLYVGYGIATTPVSNFGVRVVGRDGNNVASINTTGLPYSLDLSPDGSTILMAQSDSNFGLIDVATTNLTTQALSNFAQGSVAAFNPTGASAFIGSAGTSSIIPLLINPPVGPGAPTPSPTPTPTPTPTPLPATGINNEGVVNGLFLASSLVFVGGALVAITAYFGRRRGRLE